LFPLQLNGQGIQKCGVVSAALQVFTFCATLYEAINQLFVSVNIQLSGVCVSALCNETLMSLSVKPRLQRPQQGGRGRCHTRSTAGDAGQGPQEAQQLADTNCV